MQLQGTSHMLRLYARRERLRLPISIALLAGMAASSVVATKDLYPDTASMASAAETINATAALVALYGKVYDPQSLGAISLIKLTAFGAAIVAILFVFQGVRHTRGEEESGRCELTLGGRVGRHAGLAAALLLGTFGAVALGVATTVCLGAVGLPWSGSFTFGLGWALTGILFTAVAAVTAQMAGSARAAIGLGMGAVALSYALRAAGDLAEGDPGLASWLSPIGWSQQLRPFAGDRLWVAVLPAVVSLLLVAAAFALRSRRDLGAGLLKPTAGPGSGTLTGTAGLTWRLQRGTLLAWLIGTAAMGALLGSLVDNIAGLLNSAAVEDFIKQLGGKGALNDAFLSAEIGIVGAVVCALGISAVNRLRSEETAGHAELLLAQGASRTGWAGSHLLGGLLGMAVVLAVAGFAAGLTSGLSTGEPWSRALEMTCAALARVPAAWVLVGAAFVVFGWLPRAAVAAGWGMLVGFIVLGEFGALWKLPQWAMDLSPFAHSPQLPGGTVNWWDLAVLVLIAAGLIWLGFIGWHRRDLRP